MTLAIVIITSFISVIAFYNESFMSYLVFNPYQVYYRKEIWRLVTHGFIHANWIHLVVNMLVLYSFGKNVEIWLNQLEHAGFISHPSLTYFFLYFGGIVVSTIITLFRHKKNYFYNSVGASGAVSAVIFASIFFSPLDKIYFFAAIPVPGIVFAVIYLFYSSLMSRRSNDNINHDAHFAGAIFGFIFPILIDFSLISHFLESFSF